MSIAISDDHRALADTVTDLLTARGSRLAARALLDAADEPDPAFWAEAAGLGWLGLHLPEQYGGPGTAWRKRSWSWSSWVAAWRPARSFPRSLRAR